MTAQPSLLDWTPGAAKQARDAGLEQVSDNNREWMRRALELIETDLRHKFYFFTGEQIRMSIDARLWPVDPHAYGALINSALRKKIIRDTGRITRMEDIKSHHRKTSIYEGSQRPEAT